MARFKFLFISCFTLNMVFLLFASYTISSPKIPAVPMFDADIIKIRSMFESGEYKKLNELFEKYQDSCEKDIRWEVALQSGFAFFSVSDPSFVSRINTWVDNTPERWVPRLARAVYYEDLSYHARGYEWAQDTTDDQFNQMREYLSLTVRDVEWALKKNPKLFYAYLILLRCGKNIGEFQLDLFSKKALDIYPSSYLLRFRYMESLQPRWGGSYEKMNKFANESIPFADKNPMILTLQGSAYADMAQMACLERNYQTAIDLYERSLAFGDNYATLLLASDAYLNVIRNEKALDAINRALSLRPMMATGYVKRAKILFFM